MAFTVAVTNRNGYTADGQRVVRGTWTNDGGSTGGDITTTLANVTEMRLTLTGASAGALCPSVNETLPLAGGVVTIVTNANDTGNWVAVGV